MAIIHAPEVDKPGIKLLIDISDEEANRLIAAVNQAPFLINLKNLASVIASSLEELERDDLEEILRSIISIYALVEEQPIEVEEIVEGIINGVEKDEFFEGYSSEQLSTFRTRLTNFLQADTAIKFVSKATELLHESERIFSDSRIISDVRPIFKTEPQEGLVGALIMHTLKIGYRDTAGYKEIYLSLDSIDLMNLTEQLYKAEQKAEVLASILKESSISYVTPYPDLAEEE